MKVLIAISLSLVLAVSQAQAATPISLWTCSLTLKIKTLYPTVTRSKAKQSMEALIYDDGTALLDTHVTPYLIPSTWYTFGKNGVLYPDVDASSQAIYDTIPGIANVIILADYYKFRLNKRFALATKAAVKSRSDIQVTTTEGAISRAVGNGTGTCRRLQ